MLDICFFSVNFAFEMNTLTLFELNSMVSEAIETALPSYYWVEAELMEMREVNGHCYMELVQKDVFSATPVARASAKCWRSQWARVAAKFMQSAGSLPQVGMKVLVKVKVEFHPTYGYALIVNDIDPTYTLGDMARKRREILQTLENEGVLDLQHELELPLFCQRIAVISSATAAGYGDFCNQLNNNEYGVAFKAVLFQAVMQGVQVEESVIAALDEIALRQDEFDCVVIIRGGGAVADMSGFDTLALAENVANFPLPIITGIGHDRDECVLDVISYRKVKTPTAAAVFLIENMADVISRIDEAQRTIVSNVLLKMERQKMRLSQLQGGIMSFARLFRTREDARVEKLYMQIVNMLKQKLTSEKHGLQLISQRINALDPKLLLERGYSMTMCKGRVVKDASELHEGEEIETIFSKGKIKSVVK